MKTAHPETMAASRVNPGETLRKAREAKAWALAEVAAQLNLSAQSLQQLEAGAFDKLPGHTFSRGYVRAYAKLLGMDQALLVQEFDQFTGTDSQGANVHSLGRIEEPARLSQSILKIVTLCLLLVLGAGGFFWWQGDVERKDLLSPDLALEHVEVDGADGTTEIHPLDEPEDQAVAEAQVPDQPLPDAPVSAELAAQPEGDVPGTTTAAEAPVAAAPGLNATTPATPSAVAPSVSGAAPTAPPVTPEPVAPAAPVAGESRVHLQFSADCWTQLTDANGKVLLSALKRRGESVEFVGKAPLELRLGFARGAQVRVDGQQVDIGPFTHGETARVKLGQ